MVAVYLNTRKLGERTSNMLMIGFQLEGTRDETARKMRIKIGGIILNHTVFLKIEEDVIVGLEILIYLSGNQEESFIAFYPQLHKKFSSSFEIQAGLGFYFTETSFIPQLVHRTIVSNTDVAT